MKTYFFKVITVSIACLIVPLQRIWADIVITVDVAEKTHSTAVVVFQTTIVEIPLDDKGHGTHTFQNLGAVHANLYYGMDKKAFFMEDGDSIHFSFTGSSFKDEVRFQAAEGKERIFAYLNQVTLTKLPDEDYALPYDVYVERLHKKEMSALKLLNAWKLDVISPRFVEVEKGRIAYGYAAARIMYAAGHPVIAQDSTYRPDSAYYNDMKRMFVADEKLVELKEYREFMKEVARVFGNCRGQNCKTPYERTVCQMEYLTDNLENDYVRQVMMNVLAIEQVEQFGIQNIDELRNLHSTYVTDPVLKAAFQEKLDAWDITRSGKMSPDFRALDVSGKFYTLADFKGKYLYIDLWATWCGPCRREIPFLKKLEEDYKGRNITFLSLSTDARRSDWLKMIQAQQLSGIQLFLGAGQRFQVAYKAEGIPHFILLDPEGKIVNGNMLRPSSPDVRAYLDALPGL